MQEAKVRDPRVQRLRGPRAAARAARLHARRREHRVTNAHALALLAYRQSNKGLKIWKYNL